MSKNVRENAKQKQYFHLWSWTIPWRNITEVWHICISKHHCKKSEKTSPFLLYLKISHSKCRSRRPVWNRPRAKFGPRAEHCTSAKQSHWQVYFTLSLTSALWEMIYHFVSKLVDWNNNTTCFIISFVEIRCILLNIYHWHQDTKQIRSTESIAILMTHR